MASSQCCLWWQAPFRRHCLSSDVLWVGLQAFWIQSVQLLKAGDCLLFHKVKCEGRLQEPNMTKHHQHINTSCFMSNQFLLTLQKTVELARSLRKCVSICVIPMFVVLRHFLCNRMPWLWPWALIGLLCLTLKPDSRLFSKQHVMSPNVFLKTIENDQMQWALPAECLAHGFQHPLLLWRNLLVVVDHSWLYLCTRIYCLMMCIDCVWQAHLGDWCLEEDPWCTSCRAQQASHPASGKAAPSCERQEKKANDYAFWG